MVEEREHDGVVDVKRDFSDRAVEFVTEGIFSIRLINYLIKAPQPRLGARSSPTDQPMFAVTAP